MRSDAVKHLGPALPEVFSNFRVYWYILVDHKTAVVNQFDLYLKQLAKKTMLVKISLGL